MPAPVQGTLEVPGADPATVDTLALAPAAPRAWLVFGHGAGAGIRHANQVAIAAALAAEGVATLRVQFPFMQAGRRRVDPAPVATATLAAALVRGRELAGDAPLWLGGHSFGGRMAAHTADPEAAAPLEPGVGPAGLLYCAFPLHPAGRPGTERAAPLTRITLPQRFLSGDRDKLAEAQLLGPVVAGLPDAALHWLATADHGYRVLKRTRPPGEDVFAELARVAAGWMT